MNNIDILMIGETKLDSSFPNNQFLMQGYHRPYRLDVTARSGGLLIFVKSHLPTRQLTTLSIPVDLQILPFEINLRREKWLVVTIYRPPKQRIFYFLEGLSSIIDFYTQAYEKHIIIGDFNMQPGFDNMSEFIISHGYYNLIKKNTCFKNTGTCIDLMLTNQKYSFKNTNVFETGLSDHHLLIYSMLKTTFTKMKPKKIIYRDFKSFSKNVFLNDLSRTIGNADDFNTFESKTIDIINKHAPKKTKVLRGNHKPHVSSEMRKAIMKRS